jgi:hypothetical protein
MFTGCEIDGSGILYLRAEEPFTVDDVVAFTTAVANGAHPGVTLDMPAVLDFRRVDLIRIPTADISRYVMRRRALTDPPSAGYMAIVCGDIGSFGMLRMFGVLAELSGLRSEKLLCVTLDMAEAVGFICDRTGRADAERERLFARMEAIAAVQAARG